MLAILRFLLIVLAVVSQTTAAVALDHIRTVVYTGMPVPEAGPGVFIDRINYFEGMSLNQKGMLPFLAYLKGEGVDQANRIATYIYRPRTGSKLFVRQGNLVPGTSGDETFGIPSIPALNNEGDAAFVARVAKGPNGSEKSPALFRQSRNGEIERVASAGQHVESGERFDLEIGGFGPPTFTDQDGLLFFATLREIGVERSNIPALLQLTGESHAEVLAHNEGSVPGVPGDAKFRSIYQFPMYTTNGRAALSTLFDEENGDGKPSFGIYTTGEDGLKPIVRDGDPAPGAGGGSFSSFFEFPAINKHGQVAFQAFVGYPNNGIFTGKSKDDLRLVVMSGSPHPTGTGGRFEQMNEPILNNAGEVAFLSNRLTSIWSEGGDGILSLVAQVGDLAPIGSGEARFDLLYEHSLNDRGQSAFSARLAGATIDAANDWAIFAEDKFGALQLIAREGDMLDVSSDPNSTDYREIEGLSFDGQSLYADSPEGSFNNRGQLAFYATFTDGTSGIFISNLVAVPEPSSLVLLVIASLALTRQCRR